MSWVYGRLLMPAALTIGRFVGAVVAARDTWIESGRD